MKTKKINKIIDKIYSWVSPLFTNPQNHKKVWLVIVLFLLATWGIVFFLDLPSTTEAAWWDGEGENWQKRKQLTLTNLASENLVANTTVSVTINTKELVDAGSLQSNCADLRIVYNPDENTHTELNRYVHFPSGTTCATSEATKVYFPLQASLNSTADIDDYYLYYDNPGASAPQNTDDAFDIGDKEALLVCPLDGSTTCAAGETPNTQPALARYIQDGGALEFTKGNKVAISDISEMTTDSGTFTAEGWFYMTNSSDGTLIGKTGYTNGLRFSSGSARCGLWDGTTTFYSVGHSLNYHQWYHLACQYDQSTGEITLFVDGDEKGSTNFSGTIRDNGTTLTIAQQRVSSVGVYTIADEVRLSTTIRYTSNFTPSTSPFVSDEYTKLLLHFDEAGDDARNSGIAFDASGNNNHGTITGAKYVAGLVGIDKSTAYTGHKDWQSFAGRGGVLLEEGTTNHITNPSFEHGTYNTGWDSVGTNLTVSNNTNNAYNKFGSSSAKIVASGTGDNIITTGINIGTTATSNLSAYVYNGTSSEIGDTIDNTVAQLVFNGSAQATTTYEDAGGGWWRLSYADSGINGTAEYGLWVADGKTVYLDGVQLEYNDQRTPSYESDGRANATTYTDGSLGTGYSWNGEAHNSTSLRAGGVGANAEYSTDNIDVNQGTVSFWVKRLYTNTTAGGWNYKSGYFSTLDSGSATSNQLNVWYNSNQLVCPQWGAGTGVSLDIGKWYQVTITWDASAGYRRCFINAQQEYEAEDNDPLEADLVRIGHAQNWGAIYPSDGVLSDLKIYNDVLSQDEINSLYYSGLLTHKEGTENEQLTNDKGASPILYWKMDEGYGSTLHDTSIYSNEASLATGVSAPSWKNEEVCLNENCLQFDGSDDYVTATTPSALIKTLSFWVKPASDSENIMKLSSGVYVSVSSGTISATGFSAPTIYIDGVNNTNLATNRWQHVLITTDSAIEANDFTIGRVDSNYFQGLIDEVKAYSYVRSSDQVKSDYASRSSAEGVSAVIGLTDMSFLNNGLVAYYKMDEPSWNGTANEVIDSSGNGNHGVGVGATPPTTGAGKFGNGGVFDGVSQYANGGNNASLMPTEAITLSAWINVFQLGLQNWLLAKYETDTTYATGTGYDLYIYSDNKIYFDIESAKHLLSYDYPVDTGTWCHIVATYSKETDVGVLYINGEIVNQNSATDALTSNNGTFFMGLRGDTAATFKGKLDEVRIYNRALSPAEVKALYEWAPGPVAHYTFDDSSNNTTLADISGYGNDGTWSGSTTSRYTTGKYGSAGVFNGSDYTQIYSGDTGSGPATLTFNNDNSFTIQGWVKHDSFSGSSTIDSTLNKEIFSYNDINSASTVLIELILTGASNNKLSLRFRDNDSNSIQTTGSITVGDGKWHHISFVRNTNDDKIYTFIDGIKDVDIADTTTGNFTQYSDIWIGADSYSGGRRFFNGSLDDIRIYNYARTQKQILKDMEGSMPGAARMPQPIAHWRFDEGYGTTANNSGFGGSDLNGTLGAGTSAPTWTNEGKVGKALSFDGSNDYVSSPTNNMFNISQNGFTYSVWIKGNNFSNNPMIMGRYLPYLRITAARKAHLSVHDGTQRHVYSNISLNTGEWYHILATYDSHGYMKIYINGVLDGTAGPYSTLNNYGHRMSIGTWQDAGGSHFNGLIDDVKIYNYALSEDEVRQDYNQGKSLVMGQSSANTGSTAPAGSAAQEYCVPGSSDYCAPPVAEWLFEENTGTTARDTSGNGNDGTLVNMDNSNWVAGANSSGAALNFDGDNEYILTPLDFLSTNDITYNAWFKWDGSMGANGMRVLFSHNNDGYKTLRIHSADGLVARFSCYWDGITGTQYDSNYPINKDTWYYVSVVKTSGKLSFYLNGQLEWEPSVNDQNIYDILIGKQTTAARDWSGLIDNIRIYDYARTPAQIAWDYNQGGPIGWWKFDECQGDIAYDSSGNGNNGSINIGASSTQTTTGTCTDGSSASAWYNGASGKWNSSLSFDGEDDYVKIVDNEDVDITDSISTSSWVKFSTLGNSYILAKRDNTEQQYAVYYQNSTNLLAFYTWGANSAVSGSFSPQTDRWYHIVSTYNSSTGTGDIYVDGKAITTDNTADPITAANSDLFIAGRGDGSGGITYELNGQVDDVRIYNYVLTDKQVKTLYNQGAVHFGD